MGNARGEILTDEVEVGDAGGSAWPRRLVWAALLVWLSPAIVAVLLVGGVGVVIGAAARLAGRVALGSGGQGANRAGMTPRAPHLGTVAAYVRASRRR